MHPPAEGQNISAILLRRTDALSCHFIQIRDREAPHVHATHDLVVTLLSGQGTLNLDTRALPMQPGDTAFVARGQSHFFVNTGDHPAAAFVTFAPPYDGSDNIPIDHP
jgi:quercetin dioxygenase-like cupin family protein